MSRGDAIPRGGVEGPVWGSGSPGQGNRPLWTRIARIRRPGIPPVGLAVLLAVGIVAGCGFGADVTPGPLPTGRVVTDEAVVCGMSRGWWPREEGEGWRFRGQGEIPCWLGDPVPGGLAFRFAFVPETEGGTFRVRWDGEELQEALASEAGGLEVVVPPDRLSPGAHHLSLRRISGASGGEAPIDRLARVEVRWGDPPRFARFQPERVDSLHYLADFLLHGTTGMGRLKTSGILVQGPGSFDLELPEGRLGRLRLQPENGSSAPARFRVEVGGEVHRSTVEPGGREAMEIPLEADATAVRLEVEGREDGVFLFGAPRLVAERRPEGLPPVILVTLDTTRLDALGAYGAPSEATPNLDRFAETATVYDLALSTSPWTLPSHVSMFTGLYPSRHGAGFSLGRMPEGPPNLARLLREAGLVPVGLPGGLMMTHAFGAGRDFVFYLDPEKLRYTPGDRLTDDALELLDRTAGETPFLFVNYFDPHGPYEAPDPFPERFGVGEVRERLQEPVWKRAAGGNRVAWRKLFRGEEPLTEEGLVWIRTAYRAEVAFMDREVGRLFEGLRKRGLWEDALVVVVADHGELLGEGGFLGHSYRLEPDLVEVPFLVKMPGQSRGRRSDALVSVTDLFPAILSAVGVEVPPSDGLPLGSADGGHRRVLFEEHSGRMHLLPEIPMKIADDLWGIQERGRRQVLWPGGSDCARRGSDGEWTPEPCPGDPERRLTGLVRFLGPPPEDGGAPGNGELTEDQRSAMRTLGYL